MKQVIEYPKIVIGSSLEIVDGILKGRTINSEKINCWEFKLPTGQWYISEQDFLERKIIIWNGLEDIAKKPENIQWEYKILSNYSFGSFCEQIHKFGEEGWELITQQEILNKDGKPIGYYPRFNFILKRKKIC
jgi:hypothetical protein